MYEFEKREKEKKSERKAKRLSALEQRAGSGLNELGKARREKKSGESC